VQMSIVFELELVDKEALDVIGLER
jgi:hypothetical protein